MSIFLPAKLIAVYQNHPSVIKIRDSYGDTHWSFEFHPVAPSDISKKLKMLHTRKSTGYDNIPAKLLCIAYTVKSLILDAPNPNT